jgi:hypothetical protein
MADTSGRYFSIRDQNLISSLNNELKNNIVETLVYLFKIAAGQTNTNIYGEAKASEGKSYYSPIGLNCWMERSDLDTEDEGFGIDRNQELEFRFTQEDLKDSIYYPEMGDIIKFNERFYEIDNILSDKQLLGGQESKNFSFLIKTHYTKLSNINVVNRMI